MVSLTTGSVGEHTTLAVMIALVFAYVVNVHREQRGYEKRIEKLEEEFSRRDEEDRPQPDDIKE